jgi:hypothetical protein
MVIELENIFINKEAISFIKIETESQFLTILEPSTCFKHQSAMTVNSLFFYFLQSLLWVLTKEPWSIQQQYRLECSYIRKVIGKE